MTESNNIPDGYEAVPFSSIFSLSRGLNITKADLVDEGIPCLSYGQIHSKYPRFVFQSIDPLPFAQADNLVTNPQCILREGDFAFADTSEDYKGAGNFTCVRDSTPLFAGYHTTIARPNKRVVYSPYVAYFFDSYYFRKQIQTQVCGIKVFSITNAILNSTRVWLPNLVVQKKIANFLDKKLKVIDKVIKNKSDQLSQLSSYRQSLITRAVTKGLDPNVEMKDSGVEWIGSIPREWKTSKISFVSDVTLGKMLCPRQTDSEQTLETYLCAGSISWDGVKDYIKEMWFSTKEKSELLLIAGDVLVVEGGAGFGMTTLYKGEHSPCYFQNSIIRVRGHHNVMTSDFINYWMRFTYTAYLKTVCNEATFSHYTKEKVSETPILVPPLNEQKKIADFCKLVDERVKTICAGIENQISKLNEYRSSLISAAVTGQLAIDEEASA